MLLPANILIICERSQFAWAKSNFIVWSITIEDDKKAYLNINPFRIGNKSINFHINWLFRQQTITTSKRIWKFFTFQINVNIHKTNQRFATKQKLASSSYFIKGDIYIWPRLSSTNLQQISTSANNKKVRPSFMP